MSQPEHLYLALDELADGGLERHAKEHVLETIHEPSLCLSLSQPNHLYLVLDELANDGLERQQRHAQETIHEPSSDQHEWTLGLPEV